MVSIGEFYVLLEKMGATPIEPGATFTRIPTRSIIRIDGEPDVCGVVPITWRTKKYLVYELDISEKCRKHVGPDN